jgi:hypothetical protein
MKVGTQVTAGAVLCLALTDYWGPANARQLNAPELFRPADGGDFEVGKRMQRRDMRD